MHPISKNSVIWLSDLHLDAVSEDERDLFYHKLEAHPAERILVGGDTADGLLALQYLKEMQKKSKKQLYFILGNHDCYGSSIAVQKRNADILQEREKEIIYLTKHGPIELAEGVCLIGHDGWSDAREGSFSLSTVLLRDYFEIEELKARSPQELQEVLHELGDESAEESLKKLSLALQNYETILFLTHSPPFRESCLYANKISNDEWAPHFVNRALGDALLNCAKNHPEKTFYVLAGHSHHAADVEILPNLRVFVLPVELGMPSIHTFFWGPPVELTPFA
jgi:3',5'-cyclic-AMP phosphodiesterase